MIAQCMSEGLRNGALPAWWWFERTDGTLCAYSAADSAEIERAMRHGEEKVLLRDGSRTVWVVMRVQKREDSGRERRVIRGLWHRELPTGEVEPYEEVISRELEAFFSTGNHVAGGVQVGGREEVVRKGLKGSVIFAQVCRQTGRELRVMRGYVPEGQNTVALASVGMGGESGNVVIDMARGYTEGYADGRQAAGELAKWLQPPSVQQNNLEQQHWIEETLPEHFRASIITGGGKWYFAWGRDASCLASGAEALGDDISFAMEIAWERKVESLVVSIRGEDVRAFVQTRTFARVRDQCEGLLLRGSWFFQRSGGALYPYTEDVAFLLEVCAKSRCSSALSLRVLLAVLSW